MVARATAAVNGRRPVSAGPGQPAGRGAGAPRPALPGPGVKAGSGQGEPEPPLPAANGRPWPGPACPRCLAAGESRCSESPEVKGGKNAFENNSVSAR